jgi:hypothetical protein
MASKILINNTAMTGRAALEYAILENMKDSTVDDINNIIGTAKSFITRNPDELKTGIKADEGVKEIGNTGYYYRFWHSQAQQLRIICNLGLDASIIKDDSEPEIEENIVDDDTNDSHLHHILPKSAYPEFSNLIKNPWNGIDLPSDKHKDYHKMMGGTGTSPNRFTNWFGIFNEFCKVNGIDFNTAAFMTSFNEAVVKHKKEIEFQMLGYDIQKSL